VSPKCVPSSIFDRSRLDFLRSAQLRPSDRVDVGSASLFVSALFVITGLWFVYGSQNLIGSQKIQHSSVLKESLENRISDRLISSKTFGISMQVVDTYQLPPTRLWYSSTLVQTLTARKSLSWVDSGIATTTNSFRETFQSPSQTQDLSQFVESNVLRDSSSLDASITTDMTCDLQKSDSHIDSVAHDQSLKNDKSEKVDATASSNSQQLIISMKFDESELCSSSFFEVTSTTDVSCSILASSLFPISAFLGLSSVIPCSVYDGSQTRPHSIFIHQTEVFECSFRPFVVSSFIRSSSTYHASNLILISRWFSDTSFYRVFFRSVRRVTLMF
jgi:hypothetical protein